MQTFVRFLRFMRPTRWLETVGASISYGIIALGGVSTLLVGKSLLFGLTVTVGSLPVITTGVFLLALSIESAIFKTSIYEAEKRDENAIKRSIAKRELKNLLKNDCDLLLMSSEPDASNLGELKIQSNAAYVRVQGQKNRDNTIDKLFYVNKCTGESTEIKFEEQERKEKLNNFDKAANTHHQAATLTGEQLKTITSITRHTHKNPNLENTFLKIYKSRCHYLHKLEENKKKYYGDDKDIAENEMALTRHEIEELEMLFFKAISSEHPEAENSHEKNILNSLESLLKNSGLKYNEINTEFTKKINYITYLSIPLAIGTGVCAGLFTVGAILSYWPVIQTSLLILTGISLGPTGLVLLTTLACIFAAKGYCSMMYNTVTEMIQNDTLYDWWQEVIAFFKTPTTIIDGLKKSIRVIGILALITLMVFATIATAGTWWYLANTAVEKAPVALTAILHGVRAISGFLMIAPTFLFNIVNGLETGKKLDNKIFGDKKHEPNESDVDHPPQKDSDKFNYWNLANPLWYIQQINIFALLFKTFRGVMYVGHVISSGFTADDSGVLSAATGDCMEIAAEAFTDLPFIDHNGHSHAHDGFLLSEIETILGWASITWDYIFGYCATLGNYEWNKSQEKYYPKADLPPPPEPLTEDLGIHLTSKAIEAQIEEYKENKDSVLNTEDNRNSVTEKIDSFTKIKNKLQQTSKKGVGTEKKEEAESSSDKLWGGLKDEIIREEIPLLSRHRNILSTYSILSSTNKPESKKLIDRIKNNRSVQQQLATR